MTTYFVTGATGFLGRRLMARLLERPACDAVYALVQPGSHDKLTALTQQLPNGRAVVAVPGDLTEPGLGVDLAALPARVDHVVHLGAVYDFTADADADRAANVTGTRGVLELAERLDAGCLHHVSSVAVAGDHAGPFGERDFDLGQRLPSPYHATKFEAEQWVRQHCRVPWRVYRPAAVVGDSRTGEMDKVDGPYYFLPMISRLAALPKRLPLVAPDLGTTNLVPVDYVVAAMDHLIHADAPTGPRITSSPPPVNGSPTSTTRSRPRPAVLACGGPYRDGRRRRCGSGAGRCATPCSRSWGFRPRSCRISRWPARSTARTREPHWPAAGSTCRSSRTTRTCSGATGPNTSIRTGRCARTGTGRWPGETPRDCSPISCTR